MFWLRARSRRPEIIGKGSEKFISSSGIATLGSEKTDYDPRYFLVNALLYATEPRRPIQMLHATARPMMRWLQWAARADNAFLSTDILRDIAEKDWGSLAAAHFSTYEGKALAAKTIQDYNCVKRALLSVTWSGRYRRSIRRIRICAAVPGKPDRIGHHRSDLDEPALLKDRRIIANLQRAILLRQGWPGRSGDKLMDYLHEEPRRAFTLARML